ncbi:MAG: hypothetical protein EBR82_74770 [Caulobacteraceae bacterium]|nr:hypothetical protein [Caulobacteraceae bacterium]
MKIVELTLNDKPNAGVDTVALVEEPAIEQDFYAFNAQKYYFETYNDYPQKVRDNARIGIERNARIDNECATQVGKVRAQQLVRGENLTLDTIRRMRSFLIRQKNNFELARSRGDYWAEKKLRQAGQIFAEPLILDTFADIQKISFDFDGVLTTALGKELLQKEIDKGNQIYIISARNNKQPLIELANKYGINESNVYAAGSNLEKINTIKQLGINKHYDNNSNVIDELGVIGQQFESLSQIEYEIFKHIFATEMGLEVGTLPTYVNEPIEKRRLVGPLMIPNKLIRRVDEDTNEEYFVYFTEDTIRKLAEKFMKDGNIHSSNIEHDGIPVNGVSLIETWIIEDQDKDKSILYNQQHPVGTWMGMYKIDDDEIWGKAKRGEIKGFSVEGWFDQLLKSI